jgi:hypothetical protein
MSFFAGAGGALIGGLANMFGGSGAPEVPGYVRNAGKRAMKVGKQLYQFSQTPAMSTPQERAMLSGALAQQSEAMGAGREQLLGALGGTSSGGLSAGAQADAAVRMRSSEESTQAMTSMLAHVNSLMARQQALGDAGRQFLGVAGLGSHTQPQQQNPLGSALANFAQIASYQQALKQAQAGGGGQPVAAQGGTTAQSQMGVPPPNPLDPNYQFGQGAGPKMGMGVPPPVSPFARR